MAYSSLPCEAEANQMAFSWLVPPCGTFFCVSASASVILGSVNYSINLSAISFVYCWIWADLALLSFISFRNPVKNEVPEGNEKKGRSLAEMQPDSRVWASISLELQFTLAGTSTYCLSQFFSTHKEECIQMQY